METGSQTVPGPAAGRGPARSLFRAAQPPSSLPPASPPQATTIPRANSSSIVYCSCASSWHVASCESASTPLPQRPRWMAMMMPTPGSRWPGLAWPGRLALAKRQSAVRVRFPIRIRACLLCMYGALAVGSRRCCYLRPMLASGQHGTARPTGCFGILAVGDCPSRPRRANSPRALTHPAPPSPPPRSSAAEAHREIRETAVPYHLARP